MRDQSRRIGFRAVNVHVEGNRFYVTQIDTSVARVKAELRLTPSRWREDAAQEAELARLEGRDPADAVARYRVRELRHSKRQRTYGVIPDECPRFDELLVGAGA